MWFKTTNGQRRYNPHNIAWITHIWEKAGYQPVFFTLTAPHKHDTDITTFNSKISKAFYVFYTQYLPEITGKTFTHFLRRSENHETGHYHYHLLVLDWKFTPDDYANIRLAWIKALYRYGLVKHKDLHTAHKYAQRWNQGKRDKKTYKLGQSFGGFIDIEPIDHDTQSVSAYITSYISDKTTRGRLRGYGVFRNLVYAHSVIVLLRKLNIPQPTPDASQEEWKQYQENIYAIIQFLVHLKKLSRHKNASHNLYKALRKYILSPNPHTQLHTPTGTELYQQLLSHKIPLTIKLWLYKKRIQHGDRTNGFTEAEREFTQLLHRDISSYTTQAILSAGMKKNAYIHQLIPYQDELEAEIQALRQYLSELNSIREAIANKLTLISNIFTYNAPTSPVYWTSPYKPTKAIKPTFHTEAIEPPKILPAKVFPPITDLIWDIWDKMDARIRFFEKKAKSRIQILHYLIKYN